VTSEKKVNDLSLKTTDIKRLREIQETSKM